MKGYSDMKEEEVLSAIEAAGISREAAGRTAMVHLESRINSLIYALTTNELERLVGLLNGGACSSDPEGGVR